MSRRTLLVLLALFIALSAGTEPHTNKIRATALVQQEVVGEGGTASCEVEVGPCTDFRWETRLLKPVPARRIVVFFVPATADEPTFGLEMTPDTANNLADSIRVRSEDLQ